MWEQAVEFIGQAVTAGIIGNVSYENVNKLATWVKQHSNDHGLTSLTALQKHKLKKLLNRARQEWEPRSIQSQSVSAKGNISSPIIQSNGSTITITNTSTLPKGGLNDYE